MVRLTTRIIASLNYMPEESKKAKRSTTSVDLLVVEAIRINQRSEVDQSTIAKIAQSSSDRIIRSNQKSGCSTVS